MNKKIYIDFDGVIVDSQSQIDYFFRLFGNKITEEWNEFLKNLNWEKEVLPNCNEINNSFSILKELYKLKKEVYIFSRVFSLNEASAKIKYLEEKGIRISFISSPGRLKKSNVVMPDKSKILIDDSKDNILDWINNNGQGFYYTNDIMDLMASKNIDFQEKKYIDYDGKIYFKNCVNDLSFILKKEL